MITAIIYDFRNADIPFHCKVQLRTNTNHTSSKVWMSSSIKEKVALLVASNERNCGAKPGEISNPVKPEEDFILLGEGRGRSNKIAKLMAAKQAVENLIPGIQFDSMCIVNTGGPTSNGGQGDSLTNEAIGTNGGNENDTYAIFDHVRICDTRVPELCAKAGQPAPYLILQVY